MSYLVTNPISLEYWEISDLTEAENKLAQVVSEVILKEQDRFTVVKETVNGDDVTWVNADLDNDEEIHRYQIFNTFTGQHEAMQSLTEVKNRKQELLNQLLINLKLDSVKEFNGWSNIYTNDNPHEVKDLPNTTI
jgi:hypothetical protein